MRLRHFIIPLCMVLLFIPIYLWKVNGNDEGANAQPDKPYDATQDCTTADATVDIASIEDLARKAPVELLRQCLIRYQDAKVSGYTCNFFMHEQVPGRPPKDPEEVECWFKESPYSVMMHWKKGAGLAVASLYVAGECDNKMCVRPANKAAQIAVGLNGGFVKRPPDGSEAKESARYLITDFGLRCGTERTYKAWKALHEQGMTLNVVYKGKKAIDELGGRECHIITRYCDPPEEEGLTDVTLYIDAETWFQLGSVLKSGDKLIGSYWFRDVKLNPEFDAKQFKPETLKKY